MCQMNKEDRLHQDGMLEEILVHERERQDKGDNDDGIRNAEDIH